MFGRAHLVEWPLDPEMAYLNHGTVGVTPLRVLAAQRAIREEIERQPSRFLLRELAAISYGGRRRVPPRMRAAADIVAPFLGARGDDIVFVDNVTTAANAVMQSYPFEPGDEILVSDLSYGGVVRAARYAARLRGATVREVTMPHPPDADALVAAYVDAVGPSTRVAVVDHVTAGTALVLPMARIAAALKARGVAVFADGAHAPGAIPVDIPALGVDWYAGNLHKWAWVPRSSGILWVAPDRQAGLHSTIASWGLDQGFTSEFDLPGTRDPSAHLSAPAALALFDEWGADAIRTYNHQLAWNGARLLAERWQTPFDVPEAMIGTMASIEAPDACGGSEADAYALRDGLLFEDGIEVGVNPWRGRLRVRISAQIYNDLSDVERLADAVSKRATR